MYDQAAEEPVTSLIPFFYRNLTRKIMIPHPNQRQASMRKRNQLQQSGRKEAVWALKKSQRPSLNRENGQMCSR